MIICENDLRKSAESVGNFYLISGNLADNRRKILQKVLLSGKIGEFCDFWVKIQFHLYPFCLFFRK